MKALPKFGWKLYCIAYLGLALLPEIYAQLTAQSDLEFSIVRIGVAVLFIAPVAVYAFTEIKPHRLLATVVFYLLAFLFFSELMGFGNELVDVLTAIAVIVIHFPGFIVLHRFKSKVAPA